METTTSVQVVKTRGGRWTKDEHRLFELALEKYGRDWRRIAKAVGTRTSSQARSHAQKHFEKLHKKKNKNGILLHALQHAVKEQSVKPTSCQSPSAVDSISDESLRLSPYLSSCDSEMKELTESDLEFILPDLQMPPLASYPSTAVVNGIHSPPCIHPLTFSSTFSQDSHLLQRDSIMLPSIDITSSNQQHMNTTDPKPILSLSSNSQACSFPESDSEPSLDMLLNIPMESYETIPTLPIRYKSRWKQHSTSSSASSHNSNFLEQDLKEIQTDFSKVESFDASLKVISPMTIKTFSSEYLQSSESENKRDDTIFQIEPSEKSKDLNLGLNTEFNRISKTLEMNKIRPPSKTFQKRNLMKLIQNSNDIKRPKTSSKS